MSSSSKARERIDALLDENSFVEVGAAVTARATSFNLTPAQTPSDGVVTGYGTVNGNLVFVYSQDAAVLGGSIGEMHAKKITGLYELAIKTGAPIVGLLDSTGIRLQEATDALNAFGTIYAEQAKASGVIPQITGIFGTCGGGLALVAGMSDFAFMADGAKLFVNSPNALPGNAEDKDDTAASGAKAANGNVDAAGTEDEVLVKIRDCIDLLPSNNEDEAVTECTDDLNRASDSFEAGEKDPSVSVADLADDSVFFETKKDFAPEMATGFIRLNGATVGVVANRAASFDEKGEVKASYDTVLTTKGLTKAARFVKFCDAFELPVLTVTNVTGFAASKDEESTIAQAAASFVAALSETTSPKVNIILNAIGSAYAVMNSKAIGADITIALPDAKIGVIDARHAADILAAGKSADEKAAVEKEYDTLQNASASAAARGYVDEIADPADLRKYVIGAFEMLYTKREEVLSKKHGTV